MFRRYRVATLLNLLGLGVAVATFYLFMTQVIYNRTYNHNIHDYKHMCIAWRYMAACSAKPGVATSVARS